MKEKDIKVIKSVQPYILKVFKINGERHLSSLFHPLHTMCGKKISNDDVMIFNNSKITCKTCKVNVQNLIKQWHRDLYF